MIIRDELLPGTRFQTTVRRFGEGLAGLCQQIAAGALLLIVAICTANVIGRYVFNHAFSWAEEAMVYAMVLAIFTAVAAVTWRGAHLHLDMVLRRFSPQAQRVIVVATSLASAALIVWVSLMSLEVVTRLYRYAQTSDALGIPMWIPQGTVTLGLFLTGLAMVLRLLAYDPLPVAHDFSEDDEL